MAEKKPTARAETPAAHAGAESGGPAAKKAKRGGGGGEASPERAQNIHAGHRERLRGQFLEFGLDAFTDIQALELLLFFSLRQGDTNELAHRLLKEFRGFRGVFDAELWQLTQVEGVGTSSAALIRLVAALNQRYLAQGSPEGEVIEGTDAMAEYVKRLFAYESREKVMLICLDARRRVISRDVLAEGTVNSVTIPLRTVVEIAVRVNAARVVLAHNHLADIAIPSRADVETTGKLLQLLRQLDIQLLDHFVVADGDCVSMRDTGYLSRWL